MALSLVFLVGCEGPAETDAGVDSGVAVGVDAGAVDAGGVDAGADAGGVDAGPEDAGEADAGEDAGLSQDAGVDAGPLTLVFSPGQLVPAFDPAITEYELTEYSALTPMTVTVSGASNATIGAVTLIDGQPMTLNAGPIASASSSIVVNVGSSSYEVKLRPADWPSFTVTASDPTPGNIFLTPFEWTTTRYGHFLIVLDSDGQVVFYRRLADIGLDFKKHVLPGGAVRYSYWMSGDIYVLDEQFQPLNVFRLLPTANRIAIGADAHDFILLADDHYVLMAYYNEYAMNVPASLSPAVGGAFVVGAVIQEVQAGQVVFDWDSVDHPELYELSTDSNDFTSSTSPADYAHVNSMVIDPQDDAFVVSFRHLDAVLKLDRTTGAIVWRLGGPNDSFNTTMEQRTSHQHFAEVLGPNTIQIFDNGNAVGASRVVTYGLDPDAGAVQSFSEFELGGWYAFAMGSAQLRGETLFVGLGANGPNTPDAIEYALDGGAETFRLQFDDDVVYSYRVLKY